jgi:membrane protease subunit (stomatin/prohibitin family)
MGLIEKLRAEFVDVIEWMDDVPQTLVWRFPRYHNQIKNGAKLIVRPGQVAVFVSQGKIADVFEPGTHTLETKNLPILSTLQGWRHAFDSPFKAEVYFVATRQVTDLKWGTPNPVIVRDPQLGAVRVRAFGNFTLKAVDARRLVAELVGGGTGLIADEITTLVRAIIVSAFAELVGTSPTSVIDLAASYPVLSEKLRHAVVAHIDDEYGLDVPQLWVVNVSVPSEVEEALDARSSRSVIGDLGDYRQYQLGRSTPVAAANPAGGLAGAGVGLGMGMAYVQQGTPSATPPPVPAWHVAEQGRAVGPLDFAALAGEIAAGRVSRETLVWTAGMAAWEPASRIAALQALFPPPLPPAS